MLQKIAHHNYDDNNVNNKDRKICATKFTFICETPAYRNGAKKWVDILRWRKKMLLIPTHWHSKEIFNAIF